MNSSQSYSVAPFQNILPFIPQSIDSYWKSVKSGTIYQWTRQILCSHRAREKEKKGQTWLLLSMIGATRNTKATYADKLMDKLARKGLFQKVTFKLKHQLKEKMRHLDTKRKVFQARELGVQRSWCASLLDMFSWFGLGAKSCPTLATAWTVARQAPLPMGFSRQGYWSRLPFPSPGDLPDPGIEPGSPALQEESLPTELWGKPWQSKMSGSGKG